MKWPPNNEADGARLGAQLAVERRSFAVFGGQGAKRKGVRVKKALAVAAVVLHCLLGSGLAQENPVKAIERVEDELALAFNKYDAVALDRLWADDLSFVFPSGAIANKAQRLAGLKSPPASILSSTNESVAVKLYGDVAVALVVSKWSGTNEGQPFSTRYRATHVWAKRAGQWRLVSAHVSQMKE